MWNYYYYDGNYSLLLPTSTIQTHTKEILATFICRPYCKQIIKNVPEITFRRAPSLKDRLVQSHFEISQSLSNQTNCGTFPCGTCDVREYVDAKTKFKLPNGRWHSIQHRVTCQKSGVIYFAQCLCGGFYIGKTKRQFFKRIQDHIKPIKKNKMDILAYTTTSICTILNSWHSNISPQTPALAASIAPCYS